MTVWTQERCSPCIFYPGRETSYLAPRTIPLLCDVLLGRHVEELDSCCTGRIAVSPDGNLIGYDDDNGVIRISQLNANSWSHDIQTGHAVIRSLAFFPDGRHIIGQRFCFT